MSNIAVIGSQWGDEGKGKIVDWLSEKADVVVRFQGGHNAGHTLVIDEKVYKLHLLPSGVVRGGKKNVIGNGVVLDPFALMKEIATLREQGVTVTPQNLVIADTAPLIIPRVHAALDQALETARGNAKIGTTGRGIGPAYEDKIGRRAIRLCDLADSTSLNAKIDKLLFHHNALLRGLGQPEINAKDVMDDLAAIAPDILPFMGQSWRVIDEAAKKGAVMLFEGAQGLMLDIDHGTYPFVTSSNTVAASAAAGSGFGGFLQGAHILGITKAYTTRVGSGPFPTELFDETGEKLGMRGHEFGTTTGRKRRCGWLDAVQLRQACAVGGITSLVITKLDVLDSFDELQICTGYELDGAIIDAIPADSDAQARLKPVYETVKGWPGETVAGARSMDALPKAARAYLTRISELVGRPIGAVSTSPERNDTILLDDFGLTAKTGSGQSQAPKLAVL